MPPSPRPGTLEWLADQRPDEPVLLTPDGVTTRAGWEARAEHVAAHLAHQRGVVPGILVTVAGRIGPAWFVASWAAAKLGAGLAGLRAGPGAALPGAVHLSPAELDALTPPAGGDARRLSGAGALPDAVTFSAAGRPVRRSFTPECVGAIGPALADLVFRVRAAPGTTLVVAGDVAHPVLTFVANVVLVGGGRVISAPTAAGALALAAEHGAELAALAPADLAALGELIEGEREALDTTGVEALVTGGAALGADARAAADDLFGLDTVVDVYATADAGVVAVRPAGGGHHVLLDGVEARTTAGGLLEVRSPLAAGRGWTPTGDRAALVGETGVQLF